jgi:hypothetical protein
MKTRGLKKKDVLQQPNIIEAPSFKTGLIGSKTLNLSEISSEIHATVKKMEELGKNLVPGNPVQDELFLGVGIVVLKTQKD